MYYPDKAAVAEEGKRWARTLAYGDHWRYRFLDLDNRCLQEGELGEPSLVTDGEIRWKVRLPFFEGRAVTVMVDSPMLGESVKHQLSEPYWVGDNGGHFYLQHQLHCDGPMISGSCCTVDNSIVRTGDE